MPFPRNSLIEFEKKCSMLADDALTKLVTRNALFANETSPIRMAIQEIIWILEYSINEILGIAIRDGELERELDEEWSIIIRNLYVSVNSDDSFEFDNLLLHKSINDDLEANLKIVLTEHWEQLMADESEEPALVAERNHFMYCSNMPILNWSLKIVYWFSIESRIDFADHNDTTKGRDENRLTDFIMSAFFKDHVHIASDILGRIIKDTLNVDLPSSTTPSLVKMTLKDAVEYSLKEFKDRIRSRFPNKNYSVNFMFYYPALPNGPGFFYQTELERNEENIIWTGSSDSLAEKLIKLRDAIDKKVEAVSKNKNATVLKALWELLLPQAEEMIKPGHYGVSRNREINKTESEYMAYCSKNANINAIYKIFQRPEMIDWPRCRNGSAPETDLWDLFQNLLIYPADFFEQIIQKDPNNYERPLVFQSVGSGLIGSVTKNYISQVAQSNEIEPVLAWPARHEINYKLLGLLERPAGVGSKNYPTACIPVLDKGQLLGVLFISSQDVDSRFDYGELELFEVLSCLVGKIIQETKDSIFMRYLATVWSNLTLEPIAKFNGQKVRFSPVGIKINEYQDKLYLFLLNFCNKLPYICNLRAYKFSCVRDGIESDESDSWGSYADLVGDSTFESSLTRDESLLAQFIKFDDGKTYRLLNRGNEFYSYAVLRLQESPIPNMGYDGIMTETYHIQMILDEPPDIFRQNMAVFENFLRQCLCIAGYGLVEFNDIVLSLHRDPVIKQLEEVRSQLVGAEAERLTNIISDLQLDNLPPQNTKDIYAIVYNLSKFIISPRKSNSSAGVRSWMERHEIDLSGRYNLAEQFICDMEQHISQSS